MIVKTKCLQCGEDIVGDLFNDNMGAFTVCPKCGSSFDIDIIEQIERIAMEYEQGKMLRDDSEVEIDLFEDTDEIWLSDYSESRGSAESIEKLCDVSLVRLSDIIDMCDKHGWAYMI